MLDRASKQASKQKTIKNKSKNKNENAIVVNVNVLVCNAGNKADCPDRQVRREDGERLAREYNVAFMETSAKTGLNVDLTFLAIARYIFTNNFLFFFSNNNSIHWKMRCLRKICL